MVRCVSTASWRSEQAASCMTGRRGGSGVRRGRVLAWGGAKRQVLSTETHRRATTGNTKSREVARALEALLPRRRSTISVMRPEEV